MTSLEHLCSHIELSVPARESCLVRVVLVTSVTIEMSPIWVHSRYAKTSVVYSPPMIRVSQAELGAIWCEKDWNGIVGCPVSRELRCALH